MNKRFVCSDSNQLPLVFPALDLKDQEITLDGCYANAVSALKNWRSWPEGQLLILGPSQSGKSRLSEWWAAQNNCALIFGTQLDGSNIEELSSLSLSGLVVDDADKCTKDDALVTILNLCHQRGVPLLLTGSSGTSVWAAKLPDLVSRLQSLPTVLIEDPDTESLKRRLIAASKARFMLLPEETANYLIDRISRSFDIIEPLVDALEKSANGRSLSKVTAREALLLLKEPEL